MLNGGPVIKTNVNMRYATNANTAAQFRQACDAESVPYQEFVNRTDLACGSTIGPISAAMLSIPTVDQHIVKKDIADKLLSDRVSGQRLYD